MSHFENGRAKAIAEISGKHPILNGGAATIEKQTDGFYLVKDTSGKVLYDCATEEQGEMYCSRKGLTCKYSGPVTLGGVK